MESNMGLSGPWKNPTRIASKKKTEETGRKANTKTLTAAAEAKRAKSRGKLPHISPT